jgi:hypothetical protein
MKDGKPNYFSYLLRLWREDDDGLPQQVNGPTDQLESKPVWLASLESSLTGQRQGFASLDELFAFLRRQVVAVSDARRKDAETKGQ